MQSELSAAIKDWAGRHPEPDVAVIGIGAESYTPRQLAAAIDDPASAAAGFIDRAASHTDVTVDDIIAAFVR